MNYLAEHGVRVSRSIYSQNGNNLETIEADGIFFHVASFIKGKGTRVPDNDYRYREDAPIEEYFRNWGRSLGQMHALTKSYAPTGEQVKRPDWFELHKPENLIEERVPDRLGGVVDRIKALFDKLRLLQINPESFGLIHGDFNDGNFTVDYSNGDITVFDFDDCCYFWFMYELASAWEGGIGRIMFANLDRRKAFMDHYWEQLMEGYDQENSLDGVSLSQLPLFLQLVQVEEFLHFVQYIDEADNEMQAQINYEIRCIEDEIPYLGFFDSIYSPERPFKL